MTNPEGGECKEILEFGTVTGAGILRGYANS